MNKRKNSFFRKNPVNMLLSCLFIVLFSACFSGWKNDEGTIIINLGGEGRAAWPPNSAMLSQMDYTVTLSGNGEVIKRTSKGGGAIRTTVAVGYWNVQVNASYEKEPYAEGSAFVEVKAGQNNTVSIQMNQVIKFYKEFYSANEIEWNTARTAIANEESGTDLNYAINVTNDFELPGSAENTFGDVTGINIYLRGNHKIYLTSQGPIIRIAAEQSVTLQDVDFVGLIYRKNGAIQDNNTSLVYATGPNTSFTMTGNASLTDNANYGAAGGLRVEDGTFTMNGGTISGNSYGGVYIDGTFIMNGGNISGNTSNYGGGATVYGTFTMNGGTISGNSCTSTSAAGGGIRMNGTFTMNGGTISGNSCTGSSAVGGGVSMSGETFIMNGGTISGNSSDSSGGGLHFMIHATVTINGGTISGNTAGSGGGMYIDSMVFFMNGGTISGNTAKSDGGGLRVRSINMTGGAISGNTAANGGGVSVLSSFLISGGTVYGNNAGAALSNTASAGTSAGAALYTSSKTAIAEYGTFADPDDPSSWIKSGPLYTTNGTIRVLNGVLQ